MEEIGDEILLTSVDLEAALHVQYGAGVAVAAPTLPQPRGRSSDYPQGKECCGSNARDGRWELYGFTAEEAVGHVSHELLQTVFPEEVATIDFRLRADKQWPGRLTHTARDGHVIWAESLWQLRRADLVIEQNTDITERVELERQREVTMLELYSSD